MKATCACSIAAVCVLLTTSTASAQLIAARDGPIVYGHHHLNVTNADEHKKFWTTLGGMPDKIGTRPAEVIKFPNVLIFMNLRAPSGGTQGTTVNHVGFAVQNIRQMVDTLTAAGYPIVTGAELPRQEMKDGLAYIPDQKTYVSYVMGPDNTKVALVENKTLATPVALHHIGFAAPQAEEMKAWYVKVFGAKPGSRGSFETADLPGVNLTYSSSPDPVVGTQNRALDHIGFEVKDLENFCKKLEMMGIKLERPYTKVPALNISVAFIRDPWGTSIELTDGLDKVQ